VAAVGIVQADEDFPAVVLAAVDVDVISRPNRSVPVAEYVFARPGRRERNLFVRGQRVSVKVVSAINGMNKQGHSARIYRYQGKIWVEIDQCMLASFSEIEELVDGVHSFEELADLFKKRHAEELGEL
jgi:hypothetical protein